MFRPRLASRSPSSCHPERSEGSVSHIFLPPAPHSAPTRTILRRELLPLPPITSHQSLSPLLLCAFARFWREESALTKNAPITPLESALTRKPGEGPPLPPLEFYNSLVRTSAPTRHAGALASSILSCISAHFPSHMGVGVRAHLQPQVQLRILASAPVSRFEFRISHPLFRGPLLTSPCVTLRT